MNEFYTKKKKEKIQKTQQSNEKISIKSNVSSGYFKILIPREIHLSIVCLHQFVLSLSNDHQMVGRDHCCNRMNKVKKMQQTECNEKCLLRWSRISNHVK